jgi:uncharacterized lipoprotein YajG
MFKIQFRFAAVVAAMLLIGCSAPPTTQPVTADQRQDQILNDPMNYKPSMDHDITGGDITHVGKGMDKDLNDALNP